MVTKIFVAKIRRNVRYIISYSSFSESIMESLKDPNLNMIGVYGVGGVVKTNLVKQVAGKAEKDNLFHVVVWVTVSNTQVLERIQGQIADYFGLKFDEESVSERAARLRVRLMAEKYVLIILDDR